jgi:hypothetical protein
MKTFTWLFTSGFMLVCLACWALSYLLVRSAFPGLGIVLPAITRILLFPNTWILVCPLPWLIYAVVLSRRSELTRGAALVFAATIITATVLLVCAVVTACTLPLCAIT